MSRGGDVGADTSTTEMAEEPQYLYLTTIGRKTGLPREIEIWFTSLNGRFYLIAENWERANWVQNILDSPQVTLRVNEQD